MFSALKRLAGKSDSTGTNGNVGSSTEVRPGLQTMSTSLQKRFARGVQYNMKIIIKGDRSVGKTCLFLRLQGQKFKEEYVPSDEIAVSSIQWSYKATDDVVKVEVWDVVDKGRKRRPIDGLKLANSGDGIEEEPALDAEFLDVYKGTNGVIIVMDITKAWTFEYVQRELPKVPSNIPVLVLANHLDMNHHRTVPADKVTYFIESVERQAPVRYTEGSMRNGFGLRYLHKFLNVPFLQLQRETLLAQLTTNDEESQLTLQELDMFQEKDEANYDKFLDNLTNKRRQAAESTGVVGVPQPINTQPVEAGAIKKSMSMPAQMSAVTTPVVPTSVIPTPELVTPQSPSKSVQTIKPIKENIVAATEALTLSNLDPSIVSVEEFIPDGGGLDHSFLEDPGTPHNSATHPVRTDDDSDSEPETENPLVAGFQDDIDADDDFVTPVSAPVVSNPVKIRESPASSVSSIEDLSKITDCPMEVKRMPDILSDWLLPDKARRSSPEGREEGEGEITDSPHVIPSIVEPPQDKKKKKSSKEKKEKSSDKKKSTKEKKKKKVKKDRDELEDFLNGSTSSPVEEAYEAL